jgi:hypothetical protein
MDRCFVRIILEEYREPKGTPLEIDAYRARDDPWYGRDQVTLDKFAGVFPQLIQQIQDGFLPGKVEALSEGGVE